MVDYGMKSAPTNKEPLPQLKTKRPPKQSVFTENLFISILIFLRGDFKFGKFLLSGGQGIRHIFDSDVQERKGGSSLSKLVIVKLKYLFYGYVGCE